jgi:sigma-B regulation protein RsbU (phosphoserine phosphatase)
MEGAQMEMEPVAGLDTMIREQLTERRDRLMAATSLAGSDMEFASLLGEVDAALGRIEQGTFGLCEVCHDPVEPERLLADPLTRVCLGDLSEEQRNALERDLQLAAEIQGGLLPKPSSFGGWLVDLAYKPAGVVSGDYVDIITSGTDVYFILGDVSGKGMAASLLMSNLHAMFRSLVPLGMSLGELMTRANQLFCTSTLASQYATLVACKAAGDGTVEISNAGHLPPLVLRAGERSFVQLAGLPLGMFCDTEFETTRLRLSGGEALVLYTDGVTETVDASGREFGAAGLETSVANGFGRRPADVLRDSLAALNGFRSGTALTDDVTLLAVRYGMPPA